MFHTIFAADPLSRIKSSLIENLLNLFNALALHPAVRFALRPVPPQSITVLANRIDVQIFDGSQFLGGHA